MHLHACVTCVIQLNCEPSNTDLQTDTRKVDWVLNS